MSALVRNATLVLCGVNIAVSIYLAYVVLSPLYYNISDTIGASSLERMREESDRAREQHKPELLIRTVDKLNKDAELASSLAAQQQRNNPDLVQAAVSEVSSRMERGESTPRDGTAALARFRKGLTSQGVQPKPLAKLADTVAQVAATSVAGGGEYANASIFSDVPPSCHLEPHTDYEGSAVRWGLDFLLETAADCCNACQVQAAEQQNLETRCNLWVYCPVPEGCWSGDIYTHKHKECWLKHSKSPKLINKGRYPEEFRRIHPTAPEMVQWVSGVLY